MHFNKNFPGTETSKSEKGNFDPIKYLWKWSFAGLNICDDDYLGSRYCRKETVCPRFKTVHLWPRFLPLFVPSWYSSNPIGTQRRLYFEGHHGLLIWCITELLYLAFCTFVTLGCAFSYPVYVNNYLVLCVYNWWCRCVIKCCISFNKPIRNLNIFRTWLGTHKVLYNEHIFGVIKLTYATSYYLRMLIRCNLNSNALPFDIFH